MRAIAISTGTGSQIFDIAFHPTDPLVFAGLLSGEVKAYRYDKLREGEGEGEGEGDLRGGEASTRSITSKPSFSVRPTKKSCRALMTSEDGTRVYVVGKGRSIHTIDVETGRIVGHRENIHLAPVNRMKRLMTNLFCTGDDDGVIKLWDPRKPDAIRSYTHHFDYISDFMWMDAKRQLLSTSGDCTLSVIDIRSSKTQKSPAISEDQEDELLSVAPIWGGKKTVVGMQLGILAIYNNASGWGDCVDRVPGHPQSVDALSALPASHPLAYNTLLTGSSDGLVRLVSLFPTRLQGVLADHGTFPVERISIERPALHADTGAGESVRWLGSVGHDDVLRLTDLYEGLSAEVDETSESESEQGSESEKKGNGDEDEANSEAEDSDVADSRVAEKTKPSYSGKGKAMKLESVSEYLATASSAAPEKGSHKGKRNAKKKGTNGSEHDYSSASATSSESNSESDSDDEESSFREEKSSSDRRVSAQKRTTARSNASDFGSDSDSGDKKRRREDRKKRGLDVLGAERAKRRRPRNDEVSADPSFFDGL